MFCTAVFRKMPSRHAAGAQYFSHTPAVFPATAPVRELVHFTRASRVSGDSVVVGVQWRSSRSHFISHPRQPCSRRLTAPVVEYFSPAPAVFPVTAPVVEYFSPAPAVPHASSSAVAGGDSQGSVPGQSSAVRGGAVARGRRPQGPMPPLVAELFAGRTPS